MGHATFSFGVDHDGFMSIEVSGGVCGDFLVKERVKPEVARAGQVFGVAVTKGDDKVFTFGGIKPGKWLDPCERGENGFGSGDEVTGSVGVPADDGFTVLNGFWKDHNFMEYGVC
jgi:hypothetical protein